MKHTAALILFFLLLPVVLAAETYPDSLISHRDAELALRVESLESTFYSEGSGFQLIDEAAYGEVIFRPDTSSIPFNRALPSWNGHVYSDQSTFKVQMRFQIDGSWSPWVTVGFWRSHIWGEYGSTDWGGGTVDVDYVKLYRYHRIYQFRIVLGRILPGLQSPSVSRLSLFISDSRTTDQTDLTALVDDRPEEIRIPTEHFYQYDLDDGIGGDICSPTTVSMILRSYDITVDPVAFARANRDPIWGLFGVWPRVVQHAHEYGLDGAVTRYRSWSQARQVLENGGRIGMSIGPPLYAGHLVMLAGFDASGDPLVHDPARASGYYYKHPKYDLSRSWFEKGGIAYTFYLPDSSSGITGIQDRSVLRIPGASFRLEKLYPNPFNSRSILQLHSDNEAPAELLVHDILGRLLIRQELRLKEGLNSLALEAAGLNLQGSGAYLLTLRSGGHSEHLVLNYLK